MVWIQVRILKAISLEILSGSFLDVFVAIEKISCQIGTVEEGNTEHLSPSNIMLKILRNIFSGIFFHRRSKA
jgi:hypothetical protein